MGQRQSAVIGTTPS